MEKKNRVELKDEQLDNVSGGSIGFNPDDNGTYTMLCKYTGNTYYGVTLSQIIEIGKFAATVTEDLEGEQKIIDWAQAQGIII